MAAFRHRPHRLLSLPLASIAGSSLTTPLVRWATSWHVPARLNIPVMQLACDPLIGEHDFTTFCRRAKVRQGEPERSLVRRIHFARWSEQSPGVLLFEIRANAFCHQMVRSIVGTLVDVGRERFRSADVSAMLRERNRAVAGTVAPPHGLSLWEVGYDESSPLTAKI